MSASNKYDDQSVNEQSVISASDARLDKEGERLLNLFKRSGLLSEAANVEDARSLQKRLKQDPAIDEIAKREKSLEQGVTHKRKKPFIKDKGEQYSHNVSDNNDLALKNKTSSGNDVEIGEGSLLNKFEKQENKSDVTTESATENQSGFAKITPKRIQVTPEKQNVFIKKIHSIVDGIEERILHSFFDNMFSKNEKVKVNYNSEVKADEVWQQYINDSLNADEQNLEGFDENSLRFSLNSDERKKSKFKREATDNIFEKAMSLKRFSQLELDDPTTACLLPLLEQLGWHGGARALVEALPIHSKHLTQNDICNTLARLGYSSRVYQGRVADLDHRVLPALYVSQDGNSWIIQEANGEIARIFDGASCKEKAVLLNDQQGQIILFVQDEENEFTELKENNWIGSLFSRIKPTIWGLFGLTMIINSVALVLSLVIMGIYDLIIPSKAENTLIYFAIGIVFIVSIEIALRMVKSKAIGSIGGRFEYLVSTSAFTKTLSLPLDNVESSNLNQHSTRLRELEGLRDVFVGPFMNIALELPFMAIFLGVIWYLGGALVLVPLIFYVLYSLIGFSVVKQLKRRMKLASKQRSLRANYLLEAISNRSSIKQFNGEAIWLEKYRKISADAAYTQFRSVRASATIQILSQMLVISAGAATMTVGSYLVINGSISVGALIASMILTWKVLSPVQSLFFAFSRFENIRQSVEQVNLLMKTPSEPERAAHHAVSREFSGLIEFERVQFRYKTGHDVALIGVSFTIQPKEMITIVAPPGAGKSTLLKLILGLYTPSSGRVYMDGIDLRQINPKELRHTIGYVPQQPQNFNLSIMDEIRLSNPTVTEGEVKNICRELSILEKIESLPLGFDTILSSSGRDNVSRSLKQAIAIAGALLRNPSILLLDEPSHRLDTEYSRKFSQILGKIKGKATIIMISQKASHLRMADKLLLMERGMMVAMKTPDEVLGKIQTSKKTG